MQEPPRAVPSVRQPSDAPERRPERPIRTVSSDTLLQGARTINIEHDGSIYRLHATRLGKLILTK